MLVEGSGRKTPFQSTLGTSQDVLNENTSGNGHVSRNMRLAVAAIDLVEPYASIVGVNNLKLIDDVVPLSPRSCDSMPVVAIPPEMNEITIHWTVGGSMEVDETRLWTASADDVSDELLMGCNGQPDAGDVEFSFEGKDLQTGLGFFHAAGPQPAASGVVGPSFSTVLDVSQVSGSHELMVLVSAKVDSSWGESPNSSHSPGVPPQAHLANARTNPDWYHESANKIIQGRLDWFSLPIKLVRRASATSTVQVNNRFEPPAPTPSPTEFKTKKPSLPQSVAMSMQSYAGGRGGAGGGAPPRRLGHRRRPR